ncbi:MAG TPA: hypothetical protein VMW38_27895 [Terriglobia bacterium]|nr:hypothetical protein [Terriglobia bacterium]
MQPKFRLLPFLKSLVAVVGGNIVYLYIRKWLPESLRHEPFRLDWGIVADFWICVALWGLLDLAHNVVRKLRSGP